MSFKVGDKIKPTKEALDAFEEIDQLKDTIYTVTEIVDRQTLPQLIKINNYDYTWSEDWFVSAYIKIFDNKLNALIND